MKPASLKNIALSILLAGCLVSCSETNKKHESAVEPAPEGLLGVVTNLPEAPGYKVFQNNCMSCHSARYIQMQPNLSEKAWLGLVTKMQKSFGAPIPDSSVNGIVQYLVTVKGKS
ncbi:MAG: cytochrome c [Chitinophagaceae bacterium]